MATELWTAHDPGDVAIKLTPVHQGRLEVMLNGEKIFDRKADPNGFPNLTKINELKMMVAEKIFEFDAAGASR